MNINYIILAKSFSAVEQFYAGWKQDHGQESKPIVLEGGNHMQLYSIDLGRVLKLANEGLKLFERDLK